MTKERTKAVQRATDRRRQKRIFDKANRAFAALKADPKSWAEEQDERRQWEATLGDGLSDDR